MNVGQKNVLNGRYCQFAYYYYYYLRGIYIYLWYYINENKCEKWSFIGSRQQRAHLALLCRWKSQKEFILIWNWPYKCILPLQYIQLYIYNIYNTCCYNLFDNVHSNSFLAVVAHLTAQFRNKTKSYARARRIHTNTCSNHHGNWRFEYSKSATKTNIQSNWWQKNDVSHWVHLWSIYANIQSILYR